MIGGMASLPIILALQLAASQATAQDVPQDNNFFTAFRGMTEVCPRLVGGDPIPDAAAAEAIGLRPISSPEGQHRFQSAYDDGILQIWFEPARQMCTVHYGGGGFTQIAGVARDLAARNGFTRLSLGGRPGEVYVRPLGHGRQAQYMIVEDPQTRTAAIAYGERTSP